jgi:flagellar biogenesis protein FliO
MRRLVGCYIICIIFTQTSAGALADDAWAAPRPDIGPIRFQQSSEHFDSAATGQSNSSAGLTTAPRSADQPITLAPPSTRLQQSPKQSEKRTPSGSLVTVFGSLAVVVGLFLLVAWFARRMNPKATAMLPKEVIELMGRAPLSGRQQMHLVRIGHKLLLLSVTPTGAETLTEVTDRDEVDRLCGICQQNQPGSISSTFRQVLSQLSNEPAPPGFLGDGGNNERQVASAGTARRARLREANDVS